MNRKYKKEDFDTLKIIIPKEKGFEYLRAQLYKYPDMFCRTFTIYIKIFNAVYYKYAKRYFELYKIDLIIGDLVLAEFTRLLFQLWKEILIKFSDYYEKLPLPEMSAEEIIDFEPDKNLIIEDEDITVRVFNNSNIMEKTLSKTNSENCKVTIGLAKIEIANDMDSWFEVHRDLISVAEMDKVVELGNDKRKIHASEDYRKKYVNKAHFYVAGLGVLAKLEKDYRKNMSGDIIDNENLNSNSSPDMIDVFRFTMGNLTIQSNDNITLQKSFRDKVYALKKKIMDTHRVEIRNFKKDIKVIK